MKYHVIYVKYTNHDKNGRMIIQSKEKFYDLKGAVRFCLEVNLNRKFQHAEIIEIRGQTWTEQY